MNEASRKMLDEILAKDIGELTDEDRAIIRARASYLTEEQRHNYADVLAEGQVSTEVEEVAPKSKKSK